MTCRPKFYYSAQTYLNMGLMPPVAAPDSIWAEYTRLRRDLQSEDAS